MPTDDATLLATAERRREVLQLREAGATWEAIANTLRERHGAEELPKGWDRRYAWNDWDRELQKIQDETSEHAEQVRRMELRRLDRMMRGVWEKAIGGLKVPWKQQSEAVKLVLKIQQRRARLRGLDEPDEVDLTSGGDQIGVIDFRPPDEGEPDANASEDATESQSDEGTPSGGGS